MQGYLLSEQNANWVDENRRKQSTPSMGGQSQPSTFYQQTRIAFKNISGETMPAYGIGQIVNTTLINGTYTITVDKPNTTNSYFAKFVVNLEFDVPNGHLGTATLGNIVEVKKNSGFSTPFNQMWGIDGWELKPLPTGKAYANVNIIGDANTVNNTVLATIEPINQIFIKAPANGIPGRVGSFFGSEMCDYYVFNTSTGGITDTGRDQRIYNWGTQAACKNGDRYGVAARINDRWVVISEDCADEGSVVVPASIIINAGQLVDETDVDINGTIIIQGGQTDFTGDITPTPSPPL